ncbi:uncharacterized protein LOC116668910 isoform X1 [Camelus ferus]|uniref:Uncharacterized protein LOC116668910 isoform X1 n=1 Tax=Camelus ferus TaxID=419612 RepID=A0A8B8UF99_CAMFR|nr:uncharacterized protein LOC116668910 isoform X1 [Camelus ferus]
MVSPAEVCPAVWQLLVHFFVWAAHLLEPHISLPRLTLGVAGRMSSGPTTPGSSKSDTSPHSTASTASGEAADGNGGAHGSGGNSCGATASDKRNHLYILHINGVERPGKAIFGSQCHSAARSPGGLGAGRERGQSARTWIFCQILGCCLVGVTANTMFSWAHTFARVHNVSHCWVCTELPVDAGDGLPWHLHPASRANWSTLIRWNANRTARSPWDLRWQTIEEILRHERGNAPPPNWKDCMK